MSDEVNPALTPEEWAEFLAVSSGDAIDETERTMRTNRLRREMADAALNARRYNAAAALCLHGQRFGFTWEMVDALEGMLRVSRSGADLPRHEQALVAGVVARLRALLPPREGGQ